MPNASKTHHSLVKVEDYPILLLKDVENLAVAVKLAAISASASAY